MNQTCRELSDKMPSDKMLSDKVIFRPSKAFGTIAAPPSKSMAHRHLVCAALAGGESIVRNIELSEDIRATIGCVGNLGRKVDYSDGVVSVSGPEVSGTDSRAEVPVFRCNESGSTLRFFIPIALALFDRSRFEGSEVLMQRPLSVYEDICRNQGISFRRVSGVSGNCCGLELSGRLHGGAFEIPADISSQFISGLLFALPLLKEDSTITLAGKIESRPYIDMTIKVLGQHGIDVKWTDERTLSVPGSRKYCSGDFTVEGDWSNAAFLDALGYVGGRVEVTGLNCDSLQGDRVYPYFFGALQKGFAEIDISDCPDLGPVLMALAACFHGASFIGTRRLKIKESDRGKVMCSELSRFGVGTVLEENRIVVQVGGLSKPAEAVLSHNDHRIAMALSVVLSKTGGVLEGASAVNKSFPDFFSRLKSLGVDFDYVD